jgi:pimeloyl-ACP methyl ester carboxylesterase
MCRPTAVFVALALSAVGAGTTAAAAPRGSAVPRTCGDATRLVGEGPRKATPVLFVHGFSGSPSDFRRSLTAGTMLTTIGAIDDAATYVFDYRARSSEWVTHAAIGPALARSIDCLRRRSNRKVLVVAHSMGGLATRDAQARTVDGRLVADSIAGVVTIGTPTRGVILLSFTSGKVGDVLVQAAAGALGDACTERPGRKRQRLCALLEAASAPAVTAMTPDSAELANLPPWRPGLRVRPIAADLRLRLSVFGFGTTVSLGDIVATVESATADGTQRSLVVACHTELAELLDVVDVSPCSHANVLANRRILESVRVQVQAAVGRANRSVSP